MRMADLHANPGSDGDNIDENEVESDREAIIGAPRWVKMFGIIALVLVLLFVILHLIGGGHGGHTR
jgi:hypothetical protein